MFVVVRDGDSLAIELPETVALPIRAAEDELRARRVRTCGSRSRADDGNVRLVLSRLSKSRSSRRACLRAAAS